MSYSCCGKTNRQSSFFTNASAGLDGSRAALGVPDGDMPALPPQWLDPDVVIEPQPWFTREVIDGKVNLSVQFPHDRFRWLTVSSMEKVISSTDRAQFLQAYPELFQNTREGGGGAGGGGL